MSLFDYSFRLGNGTPGTGEMMMHKFGVTLITNILKILAL